MRRIDIMAVCKKCHLQFEITKAKTSEDAQEKAQKYHSEQSSGCDGELGTCIMFDSDRMKGLPPAPETEVSKLVRETLRKEWEKRTRPH